MKHLWIVKIPGRQKQDLDVANIGQNSEYYKALYLKLITKGRSADEATQCIKWLMDKVPIEDTKKIAS